MIPAREVCLEVDSPGTAFEQGYEHSFTLDNRSFLLRYVGNCWQCPRTCGYNANDEKPSIVSLSLLLD